MEEFENGDILVEWGEISGKNTLKTGGQVVLPPHLPQTEHTVFAAQKLHTRGEEADVSSQTKEPSSGACQTCSGLSPVASLCWGTSAPVMHVASPTASYLPAWSSLQTRSVHTPGCTFCGVKTNFSSQWVFLQMTNNSSVHEESTEELPPLRLVTLKCQLLNIKMRMLADLLPAERSECLALKGM